MSMHLLEARSLTAVTPDGRTLFSDLNLVLESGVVALVGRNGCGKSTLARILVGRQNPDAGQVVYYTQVGFLPQEVCIGSGDRIADALGCGEPVAALYRIGAGSVAPSDFDAVGERWDLAERISEWLVRFGLGNLSLDAPANSCSGGELTRLGLIRLLLEKPGLLILDEPSNHLDHEGLLHLLDFLEAWPGGVLLITHHRQLLEHCERIFELSSLGLRSYPGPWQAFHQLKQQELSTAQARYDQARSVSLRAKQQRQKAIERQHRRQQQGARARRGANQAKVLLDFSQQGSEATDARLRNQHGRHVKESRERERIAREQLESITPVDLPVVAVALPQGKRVFRLQGVTVRRGTRTLLDDFELDLNGPQRLAVTGRNGSGKSTLLHILNGTQCPDEGVVEVHETPRLLDQHQTLLDDRQSALENFRRLAPGLSESEYRTRLAVLRLRGDKALRPTGQLSGGERLKVGLACLLLGPNPPRLLLLDEPTNHQDLESIAALEEGLRQYSGALVVVSHDEEFLEHIGITLVLNLNEGVPCVRQR